MTILRTGIDLIEINRLAALNPSIRQRFLERVYTRQELEISGLEGAEAKWATLAGRFAAKEAVSKALGCGIGAVSWKDVEIVQGAQGEPMLKLHGKARQVAEELGLETWSVSISHTQTHAVAMAVAIGSQT
jgi:holo-[acyl-carrier protein] synthase